MTKRVKQLRLMAVVSAFAVFIAAASVVYGGLTWTGIDPVLIVDGKQVNIVIDIPSGNCAAGDLTGPIKVKVKVPKGVSFELISESEGCGTETITKIKRHGKDTIKVDAKVKSDEKFQVRVQIQVEGMPNVICAGEKSNNKVKCKADLD